MNKELIEARKIAVAKALAEKSLWDLMRAARDGFLVGKTSTANNAILDMRIWYVQTGGVGPCPSAQRFFNAVKNDSVAVI